MAVKLPDGATVSMQTAVGTSKTVSAVTNASTAVATSTAHGLSNGAFVAFTSGWGRANNRVFRITNVTANTFDLEGLDSSSVTLYPAGSGIGSVLPITTFTQITQILDFTTSGGEQQFTTFSFLEQDFETQAPTVTSAQSISIGIGDDPALAGYIALKAAGEARAVRALRMTLPDSSFILYYGYVSFNETPTVTKGEVMQVSASFSLLSRPVRYAS